MTNEELWKIVSTKNPSFVGDGTVTLSRAGLRKLFDVAYENGQSEGFRNGEAMEKLKPKPKNSAVDDLLKGFGL